MQIPAEPGASVRRSRPALPCRRLPPHPVPRGQTYYPDPVPDTLRTEDSDGVRSIVLTRAAEYNTITPRLRDELGAAIDEADAARDVRVILLRAEGPAFCA